MKISTMTRGTGTTTGRAMAAMLMATTALGASAIGAAPAVAQEALSYDIPAGALADVLNQYARQAGVELAYRAELTVGHSSPGLKGSYAPAEGLSRILTGSGITFRQTGPRAFTLEPAPQSADGVIQLGPVRVEGEGAGSGYGSITSDPSATEGTRSYTATGPSSTATGLALTLRETPQSVTVVTRQKMDDFGLETLTDVLEQTPGITVSRQNDGINFSSRGGTVNLKIDDNRQYNDGWFYFTSTQYSLDDMAEIDRVEVLKGSSGLINGDGAYGGTINLVRKKPTREFQASVGGSAARWDNYRVDADISGPLNADGTLRARAVAAWKDGDGFRDRETSKNQMFYGTVDFEPTPDTLVNVGFTYKHREMRGRGSTTPLQAYTSAGQFLGLMPRSFNSGAPWAGYEQDQISVVGSIEQQLGRGWTAKLQFNVDEIETPEILIGMFDNSTVINRNSYRHVKQQNENISFDIKGPVQLFGRTHDFLFGAGNSDSRAHMLRGIGAGRSLNLADVGIAYSDGGAAIPFPANRDSWNYANEHFRSKRRYVYAAGRFNLADPLKLIAGVRVTNYDRDDVTSDWWNYQMRERGVITPYAGVIVDLTRSVSIYGSYASIFKPQSARDINGKTLDPEEGQTYEAGVKGEFFGGRLNASANYFWMKTDNTAEQTGEYVTGTTNETAYRAVMGAKRRGYEVELSGELATGWQAQGSFVMNDSSLSTNSYDPKYQFKLNSTYRFSAGAFNGLTIGGGTRWQSRTSVQNAQALLEQAPYWLFDAVVRYEIGDKLTLGANIDNIFDKKYFSGIRTLSSSLYYTWGEPRSFKVSARYKF